MKTRFIYILTLATFWLVLQSANISFDIRIPYKQIEKNVRRYKISQDFKLVPEVQLSESMLQYEILRIQSDLCIEGYVYINRLNSCRAGGCSVGQLGAKDGYEFFDYYLITDKEAKIIYVKVFNYQATHGQQIMSKGWLKQFVGYNGGTNLDYGVNIQAISGATISANALIIDISKAERIISEIGGN